MLVMFVSEAENVMRGRVARLSLAACTLVFVGLTAVQAHSASPEGVWRTQADAKGQVADVAATRCGPYYCGTITKVYDTAGKSVRAPTIGTRVFWNMAGAGPEYKGRAYVPAHKREYKAKMTVQGNRMTVKGCLGPVCQSQVWTRIH
jgi:uncharacterized protein (DUF2147 family)